jgi:hypothetical protein
MEHYCLAEIRSIGVAALQIDFDDLDGRMSKRLRVKE